MRTKWKRLNEKERYLFLNDQRVFSNERFEEDKTELEWVKLPFFPGHKLVRALLFSQTVHIQGKKPIVLGEKHRSYFLYNPDTSDLRTKVVPLDTKAPSVYFANKLIGVELNESNVIDYVQYFGIVVEGEVKGEVEGEERNEPFYFLAHVDEIPWRPDVTEAEKLEILGRFATVNEQSSDGQFVIQVTKHKDLFGTSYTLTMPCIFGQMGFESNMKVASTGAIRMDDERKVVGEAFPTQESAVQYYRVEPTGALQNWLSIQKYKMTLLFLALFLPLFLVILFAYVGGTLGLVLAVSDITIGSVFSTFSTWIYNLVNHDWILWFFLVGSLAGLVLQLLSVGFLRLADYVAERHPGFFDAIVQIMSEKIKKKYTVRSKRLIGGARIVLFGLAGALISWTVVFFCYQALFGSAFANVPEAMTLRSVFGAVLDETLNWVMRGDDPIGFRAPIQEFFNYDGSLTNIGKTLRTIAVISIPIILAEQLRRLWRYSKKD